VRKHGDHNPLEITNNDGFHLSGTLEKKTDLPIQFKGKLTEGTGHLGSDYLVPASPLSSQTLQQLQLVLFQSTRVTADKCYGSTSCTMSPRKRSSIEYCKLFTIFLPATLKKTATYPGNATVTKICTAKEDFFLPGACPRTGISSQIEKSPQIQHNHPIDITIFVF